MNRRIQKTGGGMGMPISGISALLVIFAVLCLTVFAVLSMATVQADGRLADRSMAQAAGYYEADGQAEQILSQLRQGIVPQEASAAGTDEDGRTIYAYTCDLSQTQALEVRVAVKGDDYDILRWQLVSTVDWQTDESLPVWDGE